MLRIYTITNTITGHVYVGQTIRAGFQRWNKHKHDLRKGISCHLPLQAAWSRYGEAAFRYDVVEEDASSTSEKEWIAKFAKCYNVHKNVKLKYRWNKKRECIRRERWNEIMALKGVVHRTEAPALLGCSESTVRRVWESTKLF